MSLKRTGLIKFAGKDVTIIGPDLLPGDIAPEFSAQTQDWSDIHVLASTQGKIRIIAAVPSLDTPVCDRETRRFNQEAAALDPNIAIIVISTDLPFAQKRWCGAAGIEQVQVVSDHRDVEFGTNYGCLIQEVRILRRAVFVVDRKNKITYAQYMPALGEEPDYAAVLQAARVALQEN
jgi:thiol peroxidase